MIKERHDFFLVLWLGNFSGKRFLLDFGCVCWSFLRQFLFSQVCSFHKTTGSDELQLSAVDAERCFTASRLLPFFPWGPRCVCLISFDFPTRNRTRWESSFFKKECLNSCQERISIFLYINNRSSRSACFYCK